MILSHIAAMAKNRAIGKDNKLPWSIPEDMRFFKRKTQGHIMIMGRKTFESFPGHLPDRYHIVISRNPYVSDEQDVTFVTSLEEALTLAAKLVPKYQEEVFVIGGGDIYKQTLAIADRLYLTLIDKEFDGDAFYPEFSESEFLLVEQSDKAGPPAFSFRTYLRKQ